MPFQRVLVVCDEPKTVALIRLHLEEAGFRVLAAGDGQTGLDVARREHPDIIVQDLTLPEGNGLELCRQLRRLTKVGIILISVDSEDVDKLIGFELGADDYICKPFGPREVVARVRAVLRRMGAERLEEHPLSFGDVTVDPARHEVRRGGRIVSVTPTEFRILVALARNAGHALTRAQLLDKVQAQPYEGPQRSIDAHIKNLRRKIETDPRRPRFILTLYGVGYKFAGQSE